MRRRKVLVGVLACLFLLPLSASFVLAQPAPVPKTGSSRCLSIGADGCYQKGVAWPNPRFTDNGAGTVTDNLTGLMWTKDANFFGLQHWYDALVACEALEWGADGCNLYTDWRLPNYKELLSLVSSVPYISPTALSYDHPFTSVQSDYYWTSTTRDDDDHDGSAPYIVSLGDGTVTFTSGMGHGGGGELVMYVWPVRGGND